MAKKFASQLKKMLKEQTLEVREWTVEPSLLCFGNIPKPLHSIAPRVILGASWWRKTREEAYRSTNYHCQACGVSKWEAKYQQWLEGHEVYEIDYLLGRSYYRRTVPLCHLCHNYIHSGRLEWLLHKKMIPHGKYVAIIQHGDKILRDNKLQREVYQGEMADWADWRLVIDGIEYPPLFPSEKSYNQHYFKPEELY